MEVFSSAGMPRSLESAPPSTPFGKSYLLAPALTELTEQESLVGVAHLPHEEWLDGAIVQPLAPPETDASTLITQNNPTSQLWKVFGSTFITIFLAELGDKTQVATLLMSAESHAPWVVFTGAAAALVTTSLLGVLVGQWLSSRVSPKTLDTAAGITLALISVWLLLDVVKM